MALAEAKASSPENSRDMLVLVIDRSTSAEVSRINKEIGGCPALRWSYADRWKTSRLSRLQKEQEFVSRLADDGYATLLKEYVGLKLRLHSLRRSAYYYGDPYSEREDVDVRSIFERCAELRRGIKQVRQGVAHAAWGGMEPERRTAYDKPLLHAMDEHTCSFVVVVSEDESDDERCPLSATHWYHGQPLCRRHLGETKRRVRAENWRERLARVG